MRKSKLLTVLVAAAIGVSMVGCGSSGGSSSSGSSGSSSGGDVAIRTSLYVGTIVSHQTVQQVNLIRQHLHLMTKHIM